MNTRRWTQHTHKYTHDLEYSLAVAARDRRRVRPHAKRVCETPQLGATNKLLLAVLRREEFLLLLLFVYLPSRKLTCVCV